MPEGVPVDYTIEVAWEGGMRHRGGRAGGPTLLLDGEGKASPSPVDAMLVALAACSAIDVIDYLEKRRTPPSAARVSVAFSRAPSPPRRVTAAELVFQVAADTTQEHADRAAQLSFEKYCSVATTFAPDTALTWRVELSAPPHDQE
jgi:putative redox protein